MSVSAHGRTVSLPKTPQNPLRQRTNFSSRFNVIWVVQIVQEKHIASHSPQISLLYAHPASSKRGVRVVTIRGVRVAVDARRPRARGIAGRSQAWSWGCERSIRAGRAALLRTAKACGSGTRGWCQAGGGCSNPTGFVGPSIRQRRRQEEFVSGEQLCFRRPVYGRPQGWRCAPPPPAADGLDPVRPPVFRLGMCSAEAERDRSLCDG
jgi:hypothetical protein